MKAKELAPCLIIVSFLVLSCNYQDKDNTVHSIHEPLTDIKHETLLDLLRFAGVELFKTELSNVPLDKKLSVYVRECFQNENRIVDTILIAETTFYEFTSDTTWIKTPINALGIYAQREFETSEDLYIQARVSGVTGAKRRIKIPAAFNELHFWRTVKMDKFEIGKEFPIVLYGAWWDDTVNGKKVKRFCSAAELSADLSNPQLKLIPHYYLICFKVE